VCLVALASHELMNSLSPVAGCAGDHLAIWASECVSAMGRPQRRGNGGHDTDKPLAAPAAAYPLTSLPRGARTRQAVGWLLLPRVSIAPTGLASVVAG
jgi:hypothetical protein